MADRASFDIDGDSELAKALDEVTARYNDPSAGLVFIGGKVAEKTADNFRQQTDPMTGKPWEKTKEITLRSRTGGGSGGQTLKDNGTLRNAVTNLKPVVNKDEAVLSVGGQLSTTSGISIGAIAAIHNGDPLSKSEREIRVKPVRAKYLTVPLTPDAKKAGDVKTFERNARGDVFWIFRDAVGYVMEKPRRGEPIAHWMLTKETRFPQRRFMGVTQELLEEVVEDIHDHLHTEALEE